MVADKGTPNVSDGARSAIYDALCRHLSDGKLPKVVINDDAAVFVVHRETAGRIWNRATNAEGFTKVIEVISSQRVGRCGRNKEGRELTELN